MLTTKQLATITAHCNTIASLEFAYLHGSSIQSDKNRDIDIALYLSPALYSSLTKKKSLSFDLLMPLESELEQLVHIPIDCQILNSAPLSFRYRVVNSGKVLLDKNQALREQFELLSRVEYFDFRPRVHEYVKEAFS